MEDEILLDSCVACCRIDKVACLFFQSHTGHCWRHGIIRDQLFIVVIWNDKLFVFAKEADF